MLDRFKIILGVVAGTIAVSLPVVLSASGAQTFTPDNLPLTVVSETERTITFGWEPVPSFGYIFKVQESAGSDFIKVSQTNNPDRSTVKFAKGSYDYSVGALGEIAVGKASDIAQPPPPDTQAPTDPSGLSATVTQTSYNLSWNASTDNVGVTGYDVFRDGKNLGSTLNLSFNNTGLVCGTTYIAGVRAHDAAGNNSGTTTLNVTTSACSPPTDTTPPTVSMTSPSNGSTINGTITVSTNATDNVGVTKVEFYRDGSLFNTDTASPYSTSFDTTSISDGTHTFGAKAYDAANNVGTSSNVSVTVSNVTPPPPPGDKEMISVAEFNARAVAGATVANVHVTGGVEITKANVTVRDSVLDGSIEFETGASGSKLLNSQLSGGFYMWGADNIVIEGNVFDGHGNDSGAKMWDKPAGNTPSGWMIRNNTFQNFYKTDGSHTQAIYVGYSTDGLIEGNTFTNNGNTAHIFFTWFGNEANPATSYPRRICVRGNTFNETAGAFYDVNMRNEIPLSADIKIQFDADLDRDEFHGAC